MRAGWANPSSPPDQYAGSGGDLRCRRRRIVSEIDGGVDDDRIGRPRPAKNWGNGRNWTICWRRRTGSFRRPGRWARPIRRWRAGRLLLARSKSAQADYPAALALLNTLNPDTSWRRTREGNRAGQLYGVMVAMGNDEGSVGGHDEPDDAMKDSACGPTVWRSMRAAAAGTKRTADRRRRPRSPGNLAADVPPNRPAARGDPEDRRPGGGAKMISPNAAAALDNYLARVSQFAARGDGRADVPARCT